MMVSTGCFYTSRSHLESQLDSLYVRIAKDYFLLSFQNVLSFNKAQNEAHRRS